MNDKDILRADEETLGGIAGEVLIEEPWCHDLAHSYRGGQDRWWCHKCEKKWQGERSNCTPSCTVPDQIALTWPEAMKWRDWAVEKFGARAVRIAMSIVAMNHTNTKVEKRVQIRYGAIWFSVYAQPIHYIKVVCLCVKKG